jgi:hypothetical protein
MTKPEAKQALDTHIRELRAAGGLADQMMPSYCW